MKDDFAKQLLFAFINDESNKNTIKLLPTLKRELNFHLKREIIEFVKVKNLLRTVEIIIAAKVIL
jgi:uncharacterized radical SAM superfamily Fe-S cluster-containing enzyme